MTKRQGTAGGRVAGGVECGSGMVASVDGAAPFVPKTRSLVVLRAAAQGCRGCDLYCHATQAVFGEGEARARIVLVGEQPGNEEDLKGRPFVGPAGRLLDKALEKAGIDRGSCYVTNAVKHFKFEARGERRIHSKPSAREVNACRPWLEAELGVVRPGVIVALGSTAGQTLLGSGFRVMKDRGKVMEGGTWGARVVGTIHPSALLRMPDAQMRAEALREFVRDLKVAAKEAPRQ